MKKLSLFLTIALLVGASCAEADVNSCEEVSLGSVGRNYWGDSIGNGFRGEFEKQIGKEDDLFDKLAPEVEFELIPNIKFKFKFSRQVRENLPLPTNNRISDYDFFKLQVNNKLQMEFSGSASAKIFSAGANAGVTLTHMANSIPGQSKTQCEIFSKIIDQTTEKGKEIFHGACVSRDKSTFSKYYENTVNFFSKYIGKSIRYFADSEKNLKYAEDPLSPLKLHSQLGIPLDYKVFFENSNDVAVGDVIEHTTFFGLTPISVNFNLFEYLGPSYSLYKRMFRNIGFKKLYGNKVLVEIEDTVISGKSTKVYEIRPKLLGVLKVNFGKWQRNGFKRQDLVQRFEIDLNKENGVKFFKEILWSVYSAKWKLTKKSVLIDYSNYTDAVTGQDAIYTDGSGFDNRIALQFPGLFKFESRTYQEIKNSRFGSQEFSTGQKLNSTKNKNKYSLNLGLFKIKKVDNEFNCTMKFTSNYALGYEEDDSSLNMECNYYNRYAQKEDIRNIRDYLDAILDGNLKDKDRKKLNELDYSKGDRVNMYSNLSFSIEQIDHILDATEDDVYSVISKLFFGEDTKNIFARKYHHLWKKARPAFGPRGAIRRGRVNSPQYKTCSRFLHKVGITNEVDSRFDEFSGRVGNGKGLGAYSRNRCWAFFNRARNIAKKVNEFQGSFEESGRLNKILDLFLDLDLVSLAQATLVRLGGEIESEEVHFSYIITSPQLKSLIAASNGNRYDVENPLIRKSFSSLIRPEFFPRVNNVIFTYNTCEKNILFAKIKLNYRLADRDKISGHFKFTNYSVGKDEVIANYDIPFDNMIYNTHNEYIARIELDEEIEEDQSYNMYFKLNNTKGLRLSREVKIYLKKVNTLLNLNKIKIPFKKD